MINKIFRLIKKLFSKKSDSNGEMFLPFVENITRIKKQRLDFNTSKTGVSVSRKLRREAEKSF